MKIKSLHQIVHLFLVFICLFLSCSGRSDQTNTNVEVDSLSNMPNIEFEGIPTIDTSKEYPQQKLKLQDMADVEYIPFETTTDVLFENNARLMKITEDRIIVANVNKGDIYIFNHKGKMTTHINHKGRSGMEYLAIVHLTTDKGKNEIFVVNHLLTQTILVYSEDGNYKRTIRMPQNMWLKDIYDYDSNTLLAFDTYLLDRQAHGIKVENLNKMPYLFISKRDGRILDKVNLTLSDRISTMFVKNLNENQIYSVRLSYSNVLRDKQSFIIADISSDTIYQLTKDNALTPLAVRVPSVFSSKPQKMLMVEMKTDRFLFLKLVTREFDMNKMNGFPEKKLLMDFETRQMVEPVICNADFQDQDIAFEKDQMDIPGNMCTAMIEAGTLVEALENGKLHGELKRIASSLKEEDNPVLMVMRFKQ